MSRICRLLPAKSDGSQLSIGEAEHGRGLDRAEFPFEFVETSLCGCKRDLLLKNDVKQCGKALRPVPQRRYAALVDHAGKVRLAGQFAARGVQSNAV